MTHHTITVAWSPGYAENVERFVDYLEERGHVAKLAAPGSTVSTVDGEPTRKSTPAYQTLAQLWREWILWQQE